MYALFIYYIAISVWFILPIKSQSYLDTDLFAWKEYRTVGTYIIIEISVYYYTNFDKQIIRTDIRTNTNQMLSI